ncbi:hypothetical protein [Rossellomorea sp. NRS-1567]|uniref:hypothetical protein n=1 Tax=Rossellomorea sp. NRS-1567 TaxID=3233901 RepID=UPI003D280386
MATVIISIVLLFFFYMYIGIPVSYEDVAIKEAPKMIREAIYEDHEMLGYRIFQEDIHTYIYYKSDDAQNDYITTELDLKRKGGKIVATARVVNAANDGYVSYYKLLKMERISEEELILNGRIAVH